MAAYNTTENAADVDDLRRALGYEQINLFGVSYGTMLAQVIVRDQADHIRSAVLDSAYPIWEYVMADAPVSLTHYFDTIFANCANDFVCRTAYPDLPAIFAQRSIGCGNNRLCLRIPIRPRRKCSPPRSITSASSAGWSTLIRATCRVDLRFTRW